MPKFALLAVLGRMQLILHATRRTPHGASRLVQAMSTWLVKTRRAPSRHRRDARVHGHKTAAMHKLSTPPASLSPSPPHPPPPSLPPPSPPPQLVDEGGGFRTFVSNVQGTGALSLRGETIVDEHIGRLFTAFINTTSTLDWVRFLVEVEELPVVGAKKSGGWGFKNVSGGGEASCQWAG